MKSVLRLSALFLCLALLCAGLLSCTKDHGPDVDVIDPSTLARKTVITLSKNEAELPNAVFTVQLKDSYGLPMAGETLTLSGEGFEAVTATTDDKGFARFTLDAPAGVHEATFSYGGNVYYASCKNTVKLTLLSRINRSGVYVRGRSLSSIDLDALQSAGVGNVYLHQEALTRISREGIEEFIAAANAKNIAVHLWLICLWDNGDYVVPITPEKQYHQEYFTAEAAKVRDAASLKGLYGMHFDYIHFDGDEVRADDYRAKAGGGGETAITEFVRQMEEAAHAVNPNLVLSAAIMAENADLIDRYGQDVNALGEYLDFFVPMLYAGNYNEDTSWVKECMRLLRQEYPTTDFRPAVLSYLSDLNETNKTRAKLTEEVRACYDGGADGVTLFYYESGLTTLVPLEPDRG